MRITRSQLRGVVLSVDFSILDTVDALRYACGKHIAFGMRQGSVTKGSSLSSTSDQPHTISADSNVISVASVLNDGFDQGSADELTFMQQVVADRDAASMFPAINFT